MKAKFSILAAGAGLFLAALPVLAHHSFAAEYDADKPITLKGKVTKVELINPHSWIHIDVTGDDGKTENWACETAPPNGLYRQGWTRNSVKVGDEVVVDGSLAKNGSHTVNARTVKTADGRRLFAGSSGDGGPQARPEGKQ
jgi:Family of unknown function (DUF6152)